MPKLLSFLYMALLAGGTFFSALSGARILTERDLSVFFIPPRLLWVEAVRDFTLPLWNPYYFSGHPLLAVLQPGILYPPDWLLLVLPFDLAFNWIIVLHFIAAGVFTWALARELGSSKTGALVAGVSFMLSGYLFSVHNVISTLFTVTWVPLLLLVFLRALRRPSIWYTVTTGLVLACMFTAGGIEVFYASAGLILCLALFPGSLDFCAEPRLYPAAATRLGYFVIALVVFALVSAAQLLPFMELAGLSTRSGGLAYHEATTWSFALKDFIQFFIPDPYGYGVTDDKYWSNQSWLKTVYTGTIPFVLAAFFILNKRLKALPVLIAAVAGLGLALGGNNPLFRLLFDYLPFFDKFRYPVKFIFVFFLFLALSAGLGFDSLAERLKNIRRGPAPYVLLVLATLGAVALGAVVYLDSPIRAYMLGAGMDYPEYNHIDINLFNTKRVLVFFVLISAVVYGAFRSVKLRRALPLIILVLLSFDLFFAHNGYYASTEAGTYHKKGEVMERLSADASLYRVFVTPKTLKGTIRAPAPEDAEALKAIKSINLDKERLTGYNIEHRVFDINGMEVIKRGEYTDLYGLLVTGAAIDSTNILKMLNVKYVVSTPEITAPGFTLLYTVGFGPGAPDAPSGDAGLKDTMKLYEVGDTLERFHLVRDFSIVKGRDEYAGILSQKNFDPAARVLLEDDPGIPPNAVDSADGKVEVVRYGLNSIELKVEAQARSILVAAESYYPGWRAYLNGERVPVLKANMVQRAVVVPAGTSELKFEYAPWSFRVGAAVSLSSIAVISGLALTAGRRRRRRGI